MHFDDLTLIKGITPDIQKKLNEKNINTYADLLTAGRAHGVKDSWKEESSKLIAQQQQEADKNQRPAYLKGLADHNRRVKEWREQQETVRIALRQFNETGVPKDIPEIERMNERDRKRAKRDKQINEINRLIAENRAAAVKQAEEAKKKGPN